MKKDNKPTHISALAAKTIAFATGTSKLLFVSFKSVISKGFRC